VFSTYARAAALAIGAALLLSGGSVQGAPAADVVQVDIASFVYQPTTLSVPAGTTIVWNNLDPVEHTVTDFDHSYDSGPFGNTTFSKVYTTPGVYEYYCVPHPTMIGRIEVW
jgi:plastocyanin